MPVLTYPGVYVEEVPSGVRPIEAASTSTAAFFGVAERGPFGHVRKIFNFTDFQNTYGDFLDHYFLAHSVYQFFNNGGRQCYVGRVATGPVAADATIIDRGKLVPNGQAEPILKVAANSPGAWGNRIKIVVSSSDDSAVTTGELTSNQFDLRVFQETDDGTVERESFPNLTLNPASPDYAETVINPGSKFIRVEVSKQNDNQIAGYSEGDEIIVNGNLLTPNQRRFQINIHSDGIRTVDLTDALAGKDVTQLDVIRAAIETTIRNLPPLRESTPANAYKVSVSLEGQNDNKIRITSGHKSADSKVEIFDADNPLEDAAEALHLGKKHGGVEVFGWSAMRPLNTPTDQYYQLGDATPTEISEATPGSDGTLPPAAADYVDALHQLDTIRDVSLIAIPGNGAPEVAGSAMNYCEQRTLSDCFLIADVDRADVDLPSAELYRSKIATPNSYGAVYFPWLKMLDPTGRSSEPIVVPPSGFVAGLYAKIDAKRGVWKAPAGTEAMVGGAIGLITELTDEQHGVLNKDPKSVCVIRKFPAAGIVLWGARTLSSDPEYKYIPVRRMAIFLRVSIYNGIQWAVFEPNDEELWAALRLNIRSFMMNLFRQGALQGSTPSQAFFVKCDAETTTQDDINLGIVNVLVGFAPLKPAEFVVVKISQKAGQSS